MYSYPPEYLTHPVPVLAVYGLTESVEAPPLIDVETTESSNPPLQRGSSTNLSTKYTLYEATKYLNSNQPPPFKVVTVEKDYVLPQKQSTTYNQLASHSNLSPLSPESPLHPDGIMTPLWVKKQLSSISVIVGFYDLWDWQSENGSNARPKRETGPLASQVLIDPTEREHDQNLGTEINSRRKYFQEKGIKFAAVIILRQRYSDPSTEERLSSIRKQGGLDLKTSFFTIAPGSTSEIQEFANGLYRALYEPVNQYYNNRLKKIRKKKSKLPSPSASNKPPSELSSSDLQPLSVSGWLLRYEFKTAYFLESKQEIESALKSYETSYSIISEMLAPTSSITMGHVNLKINGNRWKEARVLADCINIKICKIYLYLKDATAALSQLNSHLHMFQSYSPTWGMGEQTFEYWAWLSKQYRIFADIIDAAIHAGYKVPLPTAYLTAGSKNPGSPLLGNSAGVITNSSGCNPGAILQHPGFYYHLAAMCCAERRRRFLEMEKANQDNAEMANMIATEKLVDHSSLTIELLTKSYEQFKRYRNGRMTLYLAAEIAGTYYETGKYDMAIKFFERIGKTYRKEKWHMVLTSILRWSLRCAKELGSWAKAVECLFELMSEDLPMADNKRNDIQKELLDILTINPLANTEEHPPVVIQMDQINAFATCHVQMKNQTNFVGAPIDYQITVKTLKTSPPFTMKLDSIKIMFNDARYNTIITDNGSENEPKKMELHELSTVEKEDSLTASSDLRLSKNQTKVFQGSVLPVECGELKILGVSLNIKTTNWQVGLNYPLTNLNEEQPTTRRKWLEKSNGIYWEKSLLYSQLSHTIRKLRTDERLLFSILDGRGYLASANVMQKPPSIDIKFEHAAPALLDELFELDINVTSSESEPVEATLFVEIKNVEGAVAEDYVSFTTTDRKGAPSVLKEANLGQIDPGTSLVTPVYLHGGNTSGSRLINVTVKYSIIGKSAALPVEKQESIRIPFISPFDANFELCAQSEKLAHSISPDLEKSERWLMVAAIRCYSAWDLDIKNVEFIKDETFSHPYTSLSLISRMDDFDNQVWKTGHVYNANYLFQLTSSDITEAQSAVPAGSININWKRSGQKGEEWYTSIIRLPTIQFQTHGLVAVVDIPSEIYLGEAFTLAYTVYNPTEYVADYNASIELSEAFVFSGYKQLRGRVLPLSRKAYHYTCYPLLAGKVKLPRLKVMASQQQSGEKEIPIEISGSGISIAFDNDLQPKQSNTPNSSVQPILAFVNAKREF